MSGRGRGRDGGGGRGRDRAASAAAAIEQQPPPRVYLTPQMHAARPILVGNRDFFLKIRIELIRAAYRFLQTRLDSNDRVLANVDRWVTLDGNWVDFDHIPPVIDTTIIPVLVRENMIGVYWFVNHADIQGSLSSGQVYDTMQSLKLLENYLTATWPRRLHGDLVSMLQTCVERCVGIDYAPPPPPPPQQHQPQPQQKSDFAYASGAAGFDVTAALKTLRHLVPPAEPYDPSNPLISAAAPK